MTKKERHKYYKKLLKVVCADPDTDMGFCWYITYEMPSCYPEVYAFNSKTFKKKLPELFSYNHHKPNSIYWFNADEKGWQKRINILMECIEKTKKIK